MANHAKQMRERQETRQRELQSQATYKPRFISTRADPKAEGRTSYKPPRSRFDDDGTIHGGGYGGEIVVAPRDVVSSLLDGNDDCRPRRFYVEKHVPHCQFKSRWERKSARRNEATAKNAKKTGRKKK